MGIEERNAPCATYTAPNTALLDDMDALIKAKRAPSTKQMTKGLGEAQRAFLVALAAGDGRTYRCNSSESNTIWTRKMHALSRRGLIERVGQLSFHGQITECYQITLAGRMVASLEAGK